MESAREEFDRYPSLLRRHLGALYSCPTGAVRTGDGDPGAYCTSARCLLHTVDPSQLDNCNCRWRSSSKAHPPDTAAAPTAAAVVTSDRCPVAGSAATVTPVREIFCRTFQAGIFPRNISDPDESNNGSRSTRTGPRPADSAPTVLSTASSPTAQDGSDSVHTLQKALGRLYEGLHAVRSMEAARNAGDAPHAGVVTARSQDGCVGAAQALLTLETLPPIAACPRLHAGLVPLYSPLVDTGEDGFFFLLFEYVPFRLTALTQLCHSVRSAAGLPALPQASSWRRDRNSADLLVRFVFYQLLRALDFLHSKGVVVGNLSSSNVLLTEHLWLQVLPSIATLTRGGDGEVESCPPRPPPPKSGQRSQAPSLLASSWWSPTTGAPSLSHAHREDVSNNHRRRQRYQAQRRPRSSAPTKSPGEDTPLTYRWSKGMVTNLEYLLTVNAAAGRMLGDRACHPIIPWVSDFSEKVNSEVPRGEGTPGEGKGWRDLTMTKFRLKKGDAQLDKSFSEGKPPHHIPENLSELTFTVYLARQLPLQVLRDVVRSEVVAEEYPSSVAKMYAWTPDECVPEFYTDPGVFQSSHGYLEGLPDLEVPPWCDGSPDDFIRYHRSLLESEHVSRNLHRWLDITFGYCLKGQAAVDNKNVPLSLSGSGSAVAGRGTSSGGFTLSDEDRPGFVQLFRHPHPPRRDDTRRPGGIGSSQAAASSPDGDAAPLSKGVTRPVRPVAEGASDAKGAVSEANKGSSSTAGVGAQEKGSAEAAAAAAAVKGGGASIFGVAFDDYIGADGVHPPPGVDTTGAAGSGSRLTVAEGDGNGPGELRATMEEKRRALAFAYDVELRLEPWYGRPQIQQLRNLDPSEAASTGTPTGSTSTTSSAQQRRNNGSGKRDERIGTSKAADLLACGCILSEMCAGEPVLSGPSFPGRTDHGSIDGRRGSAAGRERGGWWEAAVDLPPALRGAIGALTHADPSQRPSAQELLATAEPEQKRAVPSMSKRRGSLGRSPRPTYRELFPPYMRDVYAFLAALHQEETAHKRLLLAAAALPVLQVPLHAFSLVVPHLVALLEAPPVANDVRARRRTEMRHPATASGAGTANNVTAVASDGQDSTRENCTVHQRSSKSGRKYEGERHGASTPSSKLPPQQKWPTKKSQEIAGGNPTGKTVAPGAEVEAMKHARAWVSVLDLSAAKLGPRLALEVLLPPVLRALERIGSSEYACRLMDCHLWGVLVRRLGNGPFVRHSFSLLLTWLDKGLACQELSRHANSASDWPGRRSASKIHRSFNDSSGHQRRNMCPGNAAARCHGGEEMSGRTSADLRASRVQMAAALAISGDVYDCLGPTLAARYLVPALVDSLGRLTAEAVSTASPLHGSCPAQSASRPATPTLGDNPSAHALSERDDFADDAAACGGAGCGTYGAGASTCGGCQGDPASRALLQYCLDRAAKDDCDSGVGGGATFLVLSRALGDVCLRVDTEEVTVPLVLSRVFHQIIPTLEIALADGGSASASPTTFRVVLEVTSLLGRLLPSLCPETISHFYAGMRPSSSTCMQPNGIKEATIPAGAHDASSREPLLFGSPHGVGGGDGNASPMLNTEDAAGEVTSVPWLFSTLPLPQPVAGLDLPWSADESVPLSEDEEERTGFSRGDPEREKRCSPERGASGIEASQSGITGTQSTDSWERMTTDFIDRTSDESWNEDRNRSFSDGADVAMQRATRASGTREQDLKRAIPSIVIPKANVTIVERLSANTASVDGTQDFEKRRMHKVADVSTQFVCHVEVARLLAATAMGILGEDKGCAEKDASLKGACGRLLQASEDFFAAFSRTYGGLVFSSPTMVAALRLARELYNPLASLLGFDVMQDRVPSATRRIVSWLSKDLDHASRLQHLSAPREGFGIFRGSMADGVDSISGDAADTGEDDTASIHSCTRGTARGSDSRANVCADARRSRGFSPPAAGSVSHRPPHRLDALDSSGKIQHGSGKPIPIGSGHREGERATPLDERSSDDGMYISPGDSPVEDGDAESGAAAEGGRHEGPPRPPLLDRIQHAMKERLTLEGAGGFVKASISTKVPAEWLRPTRREARGPEVASTGADIDNRYLLRRPRGWARLERSGDKARQTGELRGVAAWGQQQHMSTDDIDDPLLPPPVSTLPPRLSSHSGEEADGGTKGTAKARLRKGIGKSQKPEVASAASGREGGRHEDGNAVDDATAVLEWPALLGAMGSKAPRSPDSRIPLVQSEPLACRPESVASSPAHTAIRDTIKSEPESVGGMTAAVAASAATNGEKAAVLSSPPRSPFQWATRGRQLSAIPPLPLPPPLQKHGVAVAPSPPSLPGTCKGVGVEIASRLRERAWHTGARAWETRQEGWSSTGDDFDADTVGSLFPLKMVMQASFLAHSNKASVTSMAVETRSESILVTGSDEGEVCVWSLRDHPVRRLSGFRSGSSGSGRGKSGSSSRPPRSAVTQLGLFEGAARACALDGLIRLWDVERSKGLAICRQGKDEDAPPLTAFSISGCGDGTTPPFDESEWHELRRGAVDGLSAFSAADDQQLAATYDGGVMHFDCRQGGRGGGVHDLFPVSRWDVTQRLESLRALPASKNTSHGSRIDPQVSSRRGDPPSLSLGLRSLCEGEGAWLAAGSGGGHVVVFDKRRPGGRPLFWWNAHAAAIVGVYSVARHLLMTVSRDRTAALWDLSRSPTELSMASSTGPMRHHPSWGVGAAYSDETASPSSGTHEEVPPVRVSTASGLPDNAPGMCPATVLTIPLGRPVSASTRVRKAVHTFGYHSDARGATRYDEEPKLPVLFAAAGDKMVASVVSTEAGVEQEVHPARFVGPSGKTIGGRRSASSGALAIRSAVVLPLRRLSLLGCADGWVRVGT